METVLGHDEDGRGVIERYLVDLRAQLAFYGVPRRRATRVVAESRDHLVQLAADEGEHRAVTRFGPPQKIAVEVARAMQPVVLFRSTLVFLGALALFVLPLYAIPENTLPPAPWDERPEYLTWKLYVSLGAFGVALLGGADRGRRRVAATRRIALVSSQPRGRVPRRERCGRRDRGRPVGPGRAREHARRSSRPWPRSRALGAVAAASLASAGRVRRFARDLPG